MVIEKRSGLFRSFRDDVRLRITAPPGAAVELSTASADVDGARRLRRREGEHRFRRHHLRARRRRGLRSTRRAATWRSGAVDGALTVNTASGDVEIRRIEGEGKVRAASGDISIDEADSSLKVQTASGDVEVDSVREGEVSLPTASGDIELGIKQGSKLWIDAKSMSGETSSELELGDAPIDGEGPLVEVRATAMSGDIRVKRA